jgi:hypothetical protein
VRRPKHDAAGGYGRQPDLQFASPETVMRLVGAPKGVRTWHCPLPNHADKDPSFSAAPGREPGTTVVACSCGQRKELLDHFRKLGYRLGPMPPLRTPQPKVNRPVNVRTSVAFRTLTRSEQAMFHLIESGETPSYGDFVKAGVHKQAIGPGIRAMQALGLIGVKRSPRQKGCKRYGSNVYWVEGKWLWWERTKAIVGKLIIKRARAVARAARKGGEDITPEMVEKSESVELRLRVPEVRVRGTDSGPVSYVGRRLASKVQDSSRPTSFDEGEHRWREAGRETPASMPNPNEGDPGPTSEDAYGYDPDPSHAWEPPTPPEPPPPEPVVSNAELHHLAADNQAEGTEPVGDVVSFAKPEPKPSSASALNAVVRAAIARFEAEVGKAGTMERRVALYRELIVPLWTSGQLNPDEIYRLTLMMQGRWPPNRGAQ